MRYLLWKIRFLRERDLQKLMRAIEKRYAEAYTDWDVYYIALHKDPALRKEEIRHLVRLAKASAAESAGLPRS